MNDYQDTPTVIGSRGGNRGTTNAAAIKAAKRSGEAKVIFISCSRVVRDFEREAKTRCNF